MPEKNKVELLTVEKACELSSLGATKVRELAKDAGAVRKIGRAYRINKQVFFDYIEREYAI